MISSVNETKSAGNCFLCSILMTETLALTVLRGQVLRCGDGYHLKTSRTDVYMHIFSSIYYDILMLVYDIGLWYLDMVAWQFLVDG